MSDISDSDWTDIVSGLVSAFASFRITARHIADSVSISRSPVQSSHTVIAPAHVSDAGLYLPQTMADSSAEYASVCPCSRGGSSFLKDAPKSDK